MLMYNHRKVKTTYTFVFPLCQSGVDETQTFLRCSENFTEHLVLHSTLWTV